LPLADIHTLPVVMDVVRAGQVLGLGRTKSYELAKTGRFPCRVIRVGKSYLVPTAELLTLLGLHPDRGSAETTTE
jgi:predicted DNA-binding transcriptional regulator AlpA